MAAGQRLRIIDVEGGQSGDLLVYRAGDIAEHLSNGRTFDYASKIVLTTGDVLWSSLSNPMLTIVEDDVGRHDFLYGACTIEMYRKQYGVTGDHPNCTENLSRSLRQLGLAPGPLPTPFNVFVNAPVAADGTITMGPALSRRGDAVTFRAEMPLSVAVSACPAGLCNGGVARPLAYELLND